MRTANTLVALIMSTALVATAAGSSGTDHQKATNETVHHETAHHHANHFAIFTGDTHSVEHDATDFTVGVDYERRLASRWGAGFVVEEVFADNTEIILAAQVFHHVGDLKLFAGPGFMSAKAGQGHGEETGEDSHVEEDAHAAKTLKVSEEGDEWREEFLFRVGGGYDFFTSDFSITPTVIIDRVGGNFAFVVGIGVGVGF